MIKTLPRSSGFAVPMLSMFFLFFFRSSGFAVPTSSPHPIVEHFGTEQGLPHNTVYGALRDSDGFLWLCTWNGIAMYDGYRFRTFARNVSGRGDVPPRKVSALIDDEHGRLWMRTIDNGFYMFDKRSAVFTDVYPFMRRVAGNLLVRKIKYVGEGKVLLVTRDKNLYLACAGSDGHPVVRRLYDASGNIDKVTLTLRHNVHGESMGYLYWMDTGMTIDAVRRGSKDMRRVIAAHSGGGAAVSRWESIIPRERRQDDSLMSEIKVCDAGARGVFILSRYGRLYHYDRSRRCLTDMDSEGFSELKSHERLYHDIFADSDGDIWLASDMHGLFKVTFPAGRFSMLFPHLFSKSGGDGGNRGIRALFRSADGMLFVGCRGERLRVVDPESGTVVHTFGEDVQNIYHIMQDRRGAIWLSSKGHGLIRATPTGNPLMRYTCEYFRHDPANPYSISSNRVYFSLQDHAGRIWVCTFGAGVNLIEEADGTVLFHNMHKTFRRYPHGDLYINVRAVEEDRDNVLWTATTNGLMRISLGDGEPPSAAVFETSGKTGPDVYSMFRDAGGNIWLGILGSGLNRITGYDSRARSAVLQRYGDGDIWCDNTITAISQDRRHNLWICTENGLSSLDVRTGAIRDYDRYSGFPPVHVEDNTACLLPDGRLLLGCREGLLAFLPEQLARGTGKKYKTFITGMRVMNRPLADFQPPLCGGSIIYADTVVLAHSQNMFSLEFATLRLSGSPQISYTYILEGFEEHWHVSERSNVAAYSSVPPGTYTFRVRAVGDDYPERRLTVVVRPPWWASWWAFTVYALLLLAAACGVFRLVTYIVRMRNEIYIHKRMDAIKKQVLRQHVAERDVEFVRRVTRLVEDNIGADISVDTLAEEMGLSRSAFFKRLKALTGQAPVDFIKELRLTRAAQLISTTALGITEIAYQVGFNDPGYFGKCFRKRFGMSPKEYRRGIGDAEL